MSEKIKEEKENTELEADIEALADAGAKKEDQTIESLNDRLPYVIPLSKTYKFEGEEIKEVDLSKLVDLSTVDAEHVERVMNKLNHHPKDKFHDVVYVKHIMMRVTGYPVEFYNMLSWKDMNTLVGRVTIYFLV